MAGEEIMTGNERKSAAGHTTGPEEQDTEGHTTSSPRKMTVEEAGRLGGKTTARRHGHEFYEKIGRKGGEARGARMRSERMHATHPEAAYPESAYPEEQVPPLAEETPPRHQRSKEQPRPLDEEESRHQQGGRTSR